MQKYIRYTGKPTATLSKNKLYPIKGRTKDGFFIINNLNEEQWVSNKNCVFARWA